MGGLGVAKIPKFPTVFPKITFEGFFLLIMLKFCTFFLHDKVKKPSNATFGKTVGSFGNLTPHSPPISGPCASFWIYSPKLYLDSKWVKIGIFVKSGLFFSVPEIYTMLKRHEKLNYEKKIFPHHQAHQK